MFFRTPPDPVDTPVVPLQQTAAQSEPEMPVRTASRLRRWFARMGAAMDRAEQRIVEDFKVPPHGG